MVPSTLYALPDNVPQSVIITYPRGSPRHLGFNSNGDLCMAATGNSDRVVVFLSVPLDTPLPPPVPLLFE